jgi:hypothetical protein
VCVCVFRFATFFFLIPDFIWGSNWNHPRDSSRQETQTFGKKKVSCEFLAIQCAPPPRVCVCVCQWSSHPKNSNRKKKFNREKEIRRNRLECNSSSTAAAIFNPAKITFSSIFAR